MSVALTPAAVRKLRKLFTLSDELRRAGNSSGDLRRQRQDELARARRALRDLDDGPSGRVVLTNDVDKELARRYDRELREAAVRERERIASIEAELREIAAREERERPARSQLAELVDGLFVACGTVGEALRHELKRHGQ